MNTDKVLLNAIMIFFSFVILSSAEMFSAVADAPVVTERRPVQLDLERFSCPDKPFFLSAPECRAKDLTVRRSFIQDSGEMPF